MSTIDDLLKLRYYHAGENTWQDLCERVTDFLYPNKYSQLAQRFLKALINKEFIPSTPVLANAGSKVPMLCSCFVLPLEDSIPGIMRSLTDTVMIQKYGGGVGLDFSPIRAENSIVSSTGGRASGPVSFMGLWNTAMEVIKQGGKRQGALMGVLNVHHPDLLRFMSAKETEGKLTNFNISVALDEDFFNDLRIGNGNTYSCGLDAKGIMSILARHAWSNGEPGIIFLDNIRNRSKYDIPISATNPCLPGFERVYTKQGVLKTIQELQIGDYIWSSEGWTRVINKVSRGVKPVFEYQFTGGKLYATKNHKIITRKGKMKLDEAKNAHIIACQSYFDKTPFCHNGIDWQTVVDGLVLGDGSWHPGCKSPRLYVGKNDFDYLNKPTITNFLGAVSEVKGSASLYNVKTTLEFNELPNTVERFIPERFMNADFAKRRSLLLGLFSANGSAVHNRITYKCVSAKMRDDVQELLSSIGIRSYFTTNKPKIVKFANGEYECRESYDINIDRDASLFISSVGFLQNYKTFKFYKSKDEVGEFYSKLVSVEYLDDIEVFDITVDNDSHTFWCGGIDTCNCGEVPLPPYGACCLGSINLNHALKECDDKWVLDYDKLNELVQIGVYGLNEVLNKTWWPLEKIAEFENKYRPIGLGVMGLADVLAKLMIPYGRDSGFINNLFYTIRDDAEKWAKVYAESARLPVNTTVLSIAPTGSIAMIAGASYGIEPYFSLSYTKKVAAGEFKGEVDILPVVLNKYGYAFSQEDREIVAETGSVALTSLPDDVKEVFRTATEIPYSEHLQVQMDVQSWVDNAVSKTINLPSKTSELEIEEIIKSAHMFGIKGLTMYRSRSRQLEVMECPTGTCSL